MPALRRADLSGNASLNNVSALGLSGTHSRPSLTCVDLRGTDVSWQGRGLLSLRATIILDLRLGVPDTGRDLLACLRQDYDAPAGTLSLPNTLRLAVAFALPRVLAVDGVLVSTSDRLAAHALFVGAACKLTTLVKEVMAAESAAGLTEDAHVGELLVQDTDGNGRDCIPIGSPLALPRILGGRDALPLTRMQYGTALRAAWSAVPADLEGARARVPRRRAAQANHEKLTTAGLHKSQSVMSVVEAPASPTQQECDAMAAALLFGEPTSRAHDAPQRRLAASVARLPTSWPGHDRAAAVLLLLELLADAAALRREGLSFDSHLHGVVAGMRQSRRQRRRGDLAHMSRLALLQRQEASSATKVPWVSLEWLLCIGPSGLAALTAALARLLSAEDSDVGGVETTVTAILTRGLAQTGKFAGDSAVSTTGTAPGPLGLHSVATPLIWARQLLRLPPAALGGLLVVVSHLCVSIAAESSHRHRLATSTASGAGEEVSKMPRHAMALGVITSAPEAVLLSAEVMVAAGSVVEAAPPALGATEQVAEPQSLAWAPLLRLSRDELSVVMWLVNVAPPDSDVGRSIAAASAWMIMGHTVPAPTLGSSVTGVVSSASRLAADLASDVSSRASLRALASVEAVWGATMDSSQQEIARGALSRLSESVTAFAAPWTRPVAAALAELHTTQVQQEELSDTFTAHGHGGWWRVPREPLPPSLKCSRTTMPQHRPPARAGAAGSYSAVELTHGGDGRIASLVEALVSLDASSDPAGIRYLRAACGIILTRPAPGSVQATRAAQIASVSEAGVWSGADDVLGPAGTVEPAAGALAAPTTPPQVGAVVRVEFVTFSIVQRRFQPAPTATVIDPGLLLDSVSAVAIAPRTRADAAPEQVVSERLLLRIHATPTRVVSTVVDNKGTCWVELASRRPPAPKPHMARFQASRVDWDESSAKRRRSQQQHAVYCAEAGRAGRSNVPSHIDHTSGIRTAASSGTTVSSGTAASAAARAPASASDRSRHHSPLRQAGASSLASAAERRAATAALTSRPTSASVFRAGESLSAADAWLWHLPVGMGVRSPASSGEHRVWVRLSALERRVSVQQRETFTVSCGRQISAIVDVARTLIAPETLPTVVVVAPSTTSADAAVAAVVPEESVCVKQPRTMTDAGPRGELVQSLRQAAASALTASLTVSRSATVMPLPQVEAASTPRPPVSTVSTFVQVESSPRLHMASSTTRSMLLGWGGAALYDSSPPESSTKRLQPAAEKPTAAAPLLLAVQLQTPSSRAQSSPEASPPPPSSAGPGRPSPAVLRAAAPQGVALRMLLSHQSPRAGGPITLRQPGTLYSLSTSPECTGRCCTVDGPCHRVGGVASCLSASVQDASRSFASSSSIAEEQESLMFHSGPKQDDKSSPRSSPITHWTPALRPLQQARPRHRNQARPRDASQSRHQKQPQSRQKLTTVARSRVASKPSTSSPAAVEIRADVIPATPKDAGFRSLRRQPAAASPRAPTAPGHRGSLHSSRLDPVATLVSASGGHSPGDCHSVEQGVEAGRSTSLMFPGQQSPRTSPAASQRNASSNSSASVASGFAVRGEASARATAPAEEQHADEYDSAGQSDAARLRASTGALAALNAYVRGRRRRMRETYRRPWREALPHAEPGEEDHCAAEEAVARLDAALLERALLAGKEADAMAALGTADPQELGNEEQKLSHFGQEELWAGSPRLQGDAGADWAGHAAMEAGPGPDAGLGGWEAWASRLGDISHHGDVRGGVLLGPDGRPEKRVVRAWLRPALPLPDGDHRSDGDSDQGSIGLGGAPILVMPPCRSAGSQASRGFESDAPAQSRPPSRIQSEVRAVVARPGDALQVAAGASEPVMRKVHTLLAVPSRVAPSARGGGDPVTRVLGRPSATADGGAARMARQHQSSAIAAADTLGGFEVPRVRPSPAVVVTRSVIPRDHQRVHEPVCMRVTPAGRVALGRHVHQRLPPGTRYTPVVVGGPFGGGAVGLAVLSQPAALR